MAAVASCYDCSKRLCDDCRTFGGFVVRCRVCGEERARRRGRTFGAVGVVGITMAALILFWFVRTALEPTPIVLPAEDISTVDWRAPRRQLASSSPRPVGKCASSTTFAVPNIPQVPLCEIVVLDEYQVCPKLKNTGYSFAADRRRGEKLAAALQHAGLIGPPDFNAYPGCFRTVIGPEALAAVVSRRDVTDVKASCCGELF